MSGTVDTSDDGVELQARCLIARGFYAEAATLRALLAERDAAVRRAASAEAGLELAGCGVQEDMPALVRDFSEAIAVETAARQRAEAEREELRGLLVTHEICAEKMKAERDRMRDALQDALTVMVEFGDLDGFRNLTNAELGALLIATVAKSRAALGGTGHE